MSKGKIVLACLIWLILLSAGAAIYRLWLVPSTEKKEQDKQAELDNKTSSSSNYRATVNLGLDAFSGYAILRSPEFKQALRSKQLKLEIQDDGADYDSRLEALAKGDLAFAAFPIDALLKASAKRGRSPATIISVIDETQGADAVVAYKEKFPTIESLNSPDTKFVLVGDSPSETLTRLILHTFKLDDLSINSIEAVGSEKELLARYKKARPGGNEVFVTWEPVVSQLIGNGDLMAKVYDSSKQSGIIVDTLVVSRDFLVKNEDIVLEVMESYFKARHKYNSESKLKELVQRDASELGAKLSDAQAQSLVEGIVFKNTQDNLAHFGLRQAAVTHVEDMIDRIIRVLSETGGLDKDPTEGNPNRLYYDRALIALQTNGFHPGASTESVSENKELVQLSEGQWNRLAPIGKVGVPPLVYARGTSRLTQSSKLKLDALIETLKTFPRAYLMVRGNASSRGDAEANKKLAKQRADAALQYLLENGVPAAKMRAMEGEITGQTEVTFVLAELPY